MNNYQNSKNTVLCAVSTDTVTAHDVSEEFVLPDYVPEVRRILFTRAQILPESKYMSDSASGQTLDFGGTVTYSVIYIDDEGKLCSTPLCSTYEASVALKSRASTVFVDTVCDNVTTRVSAPRRLTIKSRLKSRILGIEQREITQGISGKSSADELFIERLSADFDTFSVLCGSLNGIKISEKLDTGARKSVRVVLCDASVTLKDVKPSTSGVTCQGELIVKCVCESEGELFTLSKSVPIYECIGLDGVCDTDTARATARCVNLSIYNEEVGDMRELCFDATMEIDVEAYRNASSTLILDCYSTKNKIDTEYGKCELYSLCGGALGVIPFNESVKRKSKDAREIVDIICDPVYEKCDIKGTDAILLGRLCVHMIGKSTQENGACEYYCESYEIPFKHECALDGEVTSAIVRAGFSASVTDARLSDDKLHISAQIYPSICVLDKKEVEILGGAKLSRDVEYKNDASCVRVYFVNEGDVLWEIAKKYHTTRQRLSQDNSLDGFSLDGVKNLLI